MNIEETIVRYELNELLAFIFLLCGDSEQMCRSAYSDCIVRYKYNRRVEDPEKFCRGVLKEFVSNRKCGD